MRGRKNTSKMDKETARITMRKTESIGKDSSTLFKCLHRNSLGKGCGPVTNGSDPDTSSTTAVQ